MIPIQEIIQTLQEHPTQKDALKELGITRSALNSRAKTNPELARAIKEIRNKKMVEIGTSVSPNVRTQLETVAKQANTTLAGYIRQVLINSLREKGLTKNGE